MSDISDKNDRSYSWHGLVKKCLNISEKNTPTFDQGNICVLVKDLTDMSDHDKSYYGP